MSEERDRFLTEAKGECWHEHKKPENSFEGWSQVILQPPCYKCKESYENWDNPDFSTWEGFGKLWTWAIEQEDWFDEFLIKSQWFKLDGHKNFVLIHTHFINPDKFANALYKFLQSSLED